MVCPTSDQPTDVTSDDPAKEGYLYRDELGATFLSVAGSQSQSNSDDSDHDPLNLLSETEEADIRYSVTGNACGSSIYFNRVHSRFSIFSLTVEFKYPVRGTLNRNTDQDCCRSETIIC